MNDRSFDVWPQYQKFLLFHEFYAITLNFLKTVASDSLVRSVYEKKTTIKSVYCLMVRKARYDVCSEFDANITKAKIISTLWLFGGMCVLVTV